MSVEMVLRRAAASAHPFGTKELTRGDTAAVPGLGGCAHLSPRTSREFSMKMCMAQESFPCFGEDEI